MKPNVTFSIGSIALVEKANDRYRLFDSLFEKIGGKAKHLKETAKLLVVNRLDKCASIRQLPAIYPAEFYQELGFPKTPAERNTYRNLERIGDNFAVLQERFQQTIKRNGLVSATQMLDWSSAYFEGNQSELGALGYSRDGQPGKKQITFGISTGINGIPTALTVQKGNVQDKKHFSATLKTVSKILEPNALLVFDCGANTRENKQKTRKLGFHYLTLRQKQRGPYRRYLRLFDSGEKQTITLNEVRYECVKVSELENTSYVFFSGTTKDACIPSFSKKTSSLGLSPSAPLTNLFISLVRRISINYLNSNFFPLGSRRIFPNSGLPLIFEYSTTGPSTQVKKPPQSHCPHTPKPHFM